MRTKTEAQDHIYSVISSRAIGEIDTAIGQLKDNLILSREATKLLLTREWVWERLQVTLKEKEYKYEVKDNEGLLELEKASYANDKRPLQGWEGKEIKVTWIEPSMNKKAKQQLTKEQKKAIKDVLEKAKDAADTKAAIEEAKAEREKLLQMMN